MVNCRLSPPLPPPHRGIAASSWWRPSLGTPARQTQKSSAGYPHFFRCTDHQSFISQNLSNFGQISELKHSVLLDPVLLHPLPLHLLSQRDSRTCPPASLCTPSQPGPLSLLEAAPAFTEYLPSLSTRPTFKADAEYCVVERSAC